MNNQQQPRKQNHKNKRKVIPKGVYLQKKKNPPPNNYFCANVTRPHPILNSLVSGLRRDLFVSSKDHFEREKGGKSSMEPRSSPPSQWHC